MSNSSRLRSILLASCLLPVALGACSKEKKDKPAETVPAEAGKVAESAPVVDKKMAADSSAALAFLPASCAVAVHIDLAGGFKNAAVGKTFLPKLKAAFENAKSADENMTTFFKSTGLDPFTDFHEMGLCLSSIPKGGEDPKGMGVVTGSAKPGLLAALVATSKKADKFKPTKIGDVSGLERDGVIVLQLDDGTLLAGNDRALLVSAVAKPSGQNEAFSMIGSATLRVAVPTTTVKTGFSLPGSPFANFSDKISGHSSLSADLDSRSVTMSIGTASNEAATELAGMAKLLLGQVPKRPGKDVEAQAMAALAAAEVNGKGSAMVAVVTFEEATLTMGLEKLASDIK